MTCSLARMEKLTAFLRTAALALAVLVLIPIVIHLWGGLLRGSRYLVRVDTYTTGIERAIGEVASKIPR